MKLHNVNSGIEVELQLCQAWPQLTTNKLFMSIYLSWFRDMQVRNLFEHVEGMGNIWGNLLLFSTVLKKILLVPQNILHILKNILKYFSLSSKRFCSPTLHILKNILKYFSLSSKRFCSPTKIFFTVFKKISHLHVFKNSSHCPQKDFTCPPKYFALACLWHVLKKISRCP